MSDTDDLSDDAAPTQDGTEALADDASSSAPDVQSQVDDTSIDGGTEAAVVDAGTTDPDAWRKPYEELGFEGIDTPEQAQQRALDALRREREKAQEFQRQAQYYQTIHTQLSGRQQADQQEPAASEAPKGIFGEFASKWVDIDRETIAQYTTTDEEGNPQWKPDTPQEVKNQVHQYRTSQAKWNDVISDPRKLSQAIEERVEQMLADRVNGVLTERDTQLSDERAEREFFTTNDWVFEKDPVSGGPARDFNGNLLLSRQGQQFSAALQTVRNSGVTRASQQLELALALYKVNQQQRQQAPVEQRQQAAATAATQRQQMLGRKNPAATSPVTRAGISDAPAPTGSTRMSASRRAISELVEEGYSV